MRDSDRPESDSACSCVWKSERSGLQLCVEERAIQPTGCAAHLDVEVKLADAVQDQHPLDQRRRTPTKEKQSAAG